MRALFALLCVVLLGGCAVFRKAPEPSDWVAPADAPFLGGEVAHRAAAVLPVAATTVVVEAKTPADGQLPSVLSEEVVAALRATGFAVAEDAGVPGRRLRFDAFPVGVDVLLHVEIDGIRASRLYARSEDGRLEPASALTVRTTR